MLLGKLASHHMLNIEMQKSAEKSYYSLGYSALAEEDTVACDGVGAGGDKEDAEAEDDAIIFEDYSRIIEELRSHRREIEKLQSDFRGAGDEEEEEDKEDKEEQSKGARRVRSGVLQSFAIFFRVHFSVSIPCM